MTHNCYYSFKMTHNENLLKVIPLTSGFVPTVTEEPIDAESLFEEYCLDQCQQNQFLKLDG